VSPEELKSLVEVMNGGGAAAQIALALLAWKIWKGVEAALNRIAEKQDAQHAENKADLEAVKRAIVARDAARARFFEKPSPG
jgi:Asp-tRNA(Asn)/Glu-tRNA(Gln) amidotransferase B subunit